MAPQYPINPGSGYRLDQTSLINGSKEFLCEIISYSFSGEAFFQSGHGDPDWQRLRWGNLHKQNIPLSIRHELDIYSILSELGERGLDTPIKLMMQ